ncbi:hypothetical protein WOLCODRAFT_103220 [Wolfiporia cocos MD-104 SS10]|uniref:Uncharacterized protein n=1 Tax=Wolfiporia cocos (strain MD-104) TaxID=742152 RepID=A0A2H3JWD4_WOLCO|nr:hypothetical protein WOLCODRAFT_103220 [Wolfiporia cocos MD-104 SS10]
MPIEESVHYKLLDTGATEDWLWTAAVGDGEVRLGPNHRTFNLVMQHELHCLRWVRWALEGQNAVEGHERMHLTHCLNFIRQLTLCAADATLEASDVLTRNFTLNRWNEDHICADWPAIYTAMEINWKEWRGVEW